MNAYLFIEKDSAGEPTGKRVEHRADNFLEAFATYAPLVGGKLTKQKYMIQCPNGTYWIATRI